MVIKNPCVLCKKIIAKTHRALRCNICSGLVHIKCNNVTPSSYLWYMDNKNDPAITVKDNWYCISCINSQLIGVFRVFEWIIISSCLYCWIEARCVTGTWKTGYPVAELAVFVKPDTARFWKPRPTDQTAATHRSNGSWWVVRAEAWGRAQIQHVRRGRMLRLHVIGPSPHRQPVRARVLHVAYRPTTHLHIRHILCWQGYER